MVCVMHVTGRLLKSHVMQELRQMKIIEILFLTYDLLLLKIFLRGFVESKRDSPRN